MSAANETKPTIDQRRAQETVERALKLSKEQGEHFGREAKKLPTRILTSGLGHALAFVRAKANGNGDKDGRMLLCESVSAAVAERIPPAGGKAARRDLLERIVHGDAVFLRRATAEALAYLQWVGRFAEAKGLVGEEN